jgi:hypothetical protein
MEKNRKQVRAAQKISEDGGCAIRKPIRSMLSAFPGCICKLIRWLFLNPSQMTSLRTGQKTDFFEGFPAL